jgi:superfamily II DNA or RNA helicase
MKTYGTITYLKKKNRLDITTVPHVAIWLKRVFAKIDTWQYGTLSISATPENCHNLCWFMIKYPLAVEPVLLALLQERAAKYEERKLLVDQLLAGVVNQTPFDLKLPIREYQSIAVRMWLGTHGLLIADDVGLGKTLEAVAGLTEPGTLPALVVTLTHLPKQWEEQIQKFTNLTTHILKKGTPYDILKYTHGKLPDIVISNYHKLAGWAETLAPIIKTFIADEAHEFRHRGTQKYAAGKHIADAAEYRVGLSATPIFGFGGEIWNVLDLLSPGTLGTWEEFEREWCSGDKVKINDPVAFGLYAREIGVMLRRTRMEVKRELPDVTIVPHYIDADIRVLEAMKGQAIELAKLILKQGPQDFKGQKMQAAGIFDMKMRQATGIAKAPYVAEFVKFLIEEGGEPIVLYAWHRECYSILLEQLKEFNPVMYTGTESSEQKEQSKQTFLRGESKVLLISLRAGAGLDGLQDICHIAVYAELDWSPAVMEQTLGRIHRDGQDEPVIAYYLLSKHGSDPIMADILGIKKQQLEGVRDPNQDLVTKLQIEEDYIKRMAERFLADHGIEVPKDDNDKSERGSDTETAPGGSHGLPSSDGVGTQGQGEGPEID